MTAIPAQPLPRLPSTIEAPSNRLVVLTDRRQCMTPLAEVVAAALDGGARIFLFREKDLDPTERTVLAACIAAAIHAAGGLFMVASTPSLARDRAHIAGTQVVDAVHLASSDSVPLYRPALLGRSCHDVEGLAAADAEGCDYAMISPIFPTDSKPGYGPALGLDGLRRTAEATDLPLVALAGINASNAPACLAAGAAAIAAMGEVMRSSKPNDTVTRLLEAIT